MPLLTGIFASAISGRLVAADAGSMFPIATTTLSTAQGTITFSNIPQTYKHLQIRGIAKSTGAGSQDLQVGFNGLTSGYAFHSAYSNGSTATSASGTSLAYMKLGFNFVVANSVANSFGAIIIDIADYTNTNKLKTFRSMMGVENNGSGTVAHFSGFHSSSSSAITSIEIRPEADNFAASTSFALYGVQ